MKHTAVNNSKGSNEETIALQHDIHKLKLERDVLERTIELLKKEMVLI